LCRPDRTVPTSTHVEVITAGPLYPNEVESLQMALKNWLQQQIIPGCIHVNPNQPAEIQRIIQEAQA